MSSNTLRTIRDFFRPAQAPAGQPSTPGTAASPAPAPAPTASSAIVGPPPHTSNSKREAELATERPTSSLSPPPSSLFSSPLPPPRKTELPSVPGDSSLDREREIKGSDDEDSDSDSSFPELSAIFGYGNSAKPPSSATTATAFTPSTPTTSRVKKGPYNFHVSPLAVLPKYRFDLKSLISHVEADEATEASSKRVKAMLASSGDEDDSPVFASESHVNSTNLAPGGLLESVVADQEEGGMKKVTRALMRTEATHVEKRWYFFDTQSQAPVHPRSSFPTKSLPASWKKELSNPKTRNQTFISGFAEDMVFFGKPLPDEILLWILDEVCFEPREALRTSYLSTIKESREQIGRLVTPDLVERVFQNLGATAVATTVTEAMKPSLGLKDPYPNHDWANLRSVVRFFGRTARQLRQKSREHILCLLLRMSADHIVCKSIDILNVFQDAIRRLCRYIPDDAWETSCHAICTLLFNTARQAPLRLQIVDSIPSITPRTHELRRRLAMCFFFNDLSHSSTPPHTAIDLNWFIDRLEDPAFDTNSRTDYHELSALVSLLDIAVDDGRSVNVDLTDNETAQRFDDDVDALVEAIREVMRCIGNPGAAYISRIEAKEGLELVSQRISDTLRTKPKRRAMHFDNPRGKTIEDLEKEKAGMSAFLSKMKGKVDAKSQSLK
ncbi:uncharacterized protein BP5553_04565 [Venustampulla echinocandica]|uniref:Uncharacterized protein n=1 Tax=Venustampulla echinocandica TaxID=2656787 RepID=A0A370TNM6_9HELO|nr:uncharacterized protein BP5553_04565 [Venustampulla echinocandica]RDL37132.1 hypothetical protein BP5553_04565 [Venustampulla echinocandica]